MPPQSNIRMKFTSAIAVATTTFAASSSAQGASAIADPPVEATMPTSVAPTSTMYALPPLYTIPSIRDVPTPTIVQTSTLPTISRYSPSEASSFSSLLAIGSKSFSTIYLAAAPTNTPDAVSEHDDNELQVRQSVGVGECMAWKARECTNLQAGLCWLLPPNVMGCDKCPNC